MTLNHKTTAKPGLSLKAYRALTNIAAPFAPLILAWRTRRGKEEPGRRPERYGLASAPRPAGFLAWFHAASVGETNAALPVIEAIAAERPDMRMLLTTATVTSARLARTRLPRGVPHQYVPLDNHDLRAALLATIGAPTWRCWSKSEIWPNLVLETKARDVPLVLINGRMSSSLFQRWRSRPGLSRPLFSAFDLVLAQNGAWPSASLQLGVARSPRRGQPQGRRAAAAGRSAGTAQARCRACRAHGVARGQHPSRRRRDGDGARIAK